MIKVSHYILRKKFHIKCLKIDHFESDIQKVETTKNEEEISKGRVGLNVYRYYTKMTGIFLSAVILIFLTLMQGRLFNFLS